MEKARITGYAVTCRVAGPAASFMLVGGDRVHIYTTRKSAVLMAKELNSEVIPRRQDPKYCVRPVDIVYPATLDRPVTVTSTDPETFRRVQQQVREDNERRQTVGPPTMWDLRTFKYVMSFVGLSAVMGIIIGAVTALILNALGLLN